MPQPWVPGVGAGGLLPWSPLTSLGPGSPLLASLPCQTSVWAVVHLCPRAPAQPSCLPGACKPVAQGLASPNCRLLSGPTPSPSWGSCSQHCLRAPQGGVTIPQRPLLPGAHFRRPTSLTPRTLSHFHTGATACSPPQRRGTRGTVKIDITPSHVRGSCSGFFFNSNFFDKIFSHGGRHWECPFGGCS